VSTHEAIRKEETGGSGGAGVAGGAPVAGTQDRAKRLLHELRGLVKDEHPAFTIFPTDEDIGFWKILMKGPEDTPYAGGAFLLYANFPSNYPTVAPEIRFITPIYHCNVNPEGRICHSIFDRNYSSTTSVRLILDCVFGLMLAPEPEDPLDSRLAEDYYASKEAYDANAKASTLEHASKSVEELQAELLTDLD